jgi:glucose-1-phosphate thymidylyltransferase
MEIEYAEQPSPDGLAQALIIAEDFLAGSPSALILGDNLFFGRAFTSAIRKSVTAKSGAVIFGYEVKNPGDYGVVGFDDSHTVISLVEKPERPASNYAVTGLYFYDGKASEYAKTITPSARGELEITALNQIYLDRKELAVELLHDGTTWLDTGTHRRLLEAAQFVSVLESRSGRRICCPEVESYRQGWIDAKQLRALAVPLAKSGYGEYLLKAAKQKQRR